MPEPAPTYAELHAQYVANGFVMHHPFLLADRGPLCWCGRDELHALHDQER